MLEYDAITAKTQKEKDEAIIGASQTAVYFVFGEILGLIGRYYEGITDTITSAINSVISSFIYGESYVWEE